MAKPRVRASVKAQVTPPGFISVFKKEAIMLANKTSHDFADDIVKEAKEIIKKQKYKWAPLNEKYLEHKKKKGLDERILMATGDYVDKGIGKWEKDGRLFVGPVPGIHKPSGLPYQLIARYFEYGTWKMPARPLWRPLISSLLRKQKKYRKKYDAAIRRAMKKQERTKTKVRKI